MVLLLVSHKITPNWEVIRKMREAYHFEWEYGVEVNDQEEVILGVDGKVSFYSPNTYEIDLLHLLFGGREIGVIG